MPILSLEMSERKRSANWVPSEKFLLLDLVSHHYSALENKKTDAVSIRQKNAVWARIADEYNTQTVVDIHRRPENLRAQWETLKKYTKKLVRQNQETGAGIKYKDDPVIKKALSILGLQLTFDFRTSAGDLSHQFDTESMSSIENIETLPGCKLKVELSQDPVEPELETELFVTKPIEYAHPSDPLSSQSQDSPMPMSQSWGDYTIKRHKTLPTPLQNSSKPAHTPNTLSMKRYSSPPPETSEQDLFARKKKAIEIQIKFAAEEREEAKKIFQVKYETEKEKLKQEKLKTRLLLSELRKSRRANKQ